MLAIGLVELQVKRIASLGQHEPVAQVVEHQRLVAAVDDVVRVRGAARVGVHLDRHVCNPDTQHLVERAQCLEIALDQVIVHRDDMDRDARQGGGAGSQRGRQGLALAGLHLGHHAVEHDPGAPELDVEMTHAERLICRLPYQGERTCGKRLGETLPPQAQPELTRLGRQLDRIVVTIAVTHCGDLRNDTVPACCARTQRPQDTAGSRLSGTVEPGLVGRIRPLRIDVVEQRCRDHEARHRIRSDVELLEERAP